MVKKNKIHVLFGRKGSGKTWEMKKLSQNMQRVFIFDVTNDFSGGFIFDNFDDFDNAFDVFMYRQNFRVILKFGKDTEDYEDALDIIWNSDLTNYDLVIDEIHLFASPNSISKNFSNIFAVGRHSSLSITCATQRPYKVNPIVRSQADIVTTFRQTEPRDLQLLKEIGFSENEVLSLGQYEKITIEI